MADDFQILKLQDWHPDALVEHLPSEYSRATMATICDRFQPPCSYYLISLRKAYKKLDKKGVPYKRIEGREVQNDGKEGSLHVDLNFYGKYAEEIHSYLTQEHNNKAPNKLWLALSDIKLSPYPGMDSHLWDKYSIFIGNPHNRASKARVWVVTPEQVLSPGKRWKCGTPLDQCRRLAGSKVTACVVVKQVIKSNALTRNLTMHSLYAVVDSTCFRGDGGNLERVIPDLLVHVFDNRKGEREGETGLSVSTSDILFIRDMLLENYQNRCYGKVFHPNCITVFSGSVEDPLDSTTTSTSFKIKDEYLRRVSELRRWWADTEPHIQALDKYESEANTARRPNPNQGTTTQMQAPTTTQTQAPGQEEEAQGSQRRLGEATTQTSGQEDCPERTLSIAERRKGQEPEHQDQERTIPQQKQPGQPQRNLQPNQTPGQKHGEGGRVAADGPPPCTVADISDRARVTLYCQVLEVGGVCLYDTKLVVMRVTDGTLAQAKYIQYDLSKGADENQDGEQVGNVGSPTVDVLYPAPPDELQHIKAEDYICLKGLVCRAVEDDEFELAFTLSSFLTILTPDQPQWVALHRRLKGETSEEADAERGSRRSENEVQSCNKRLRLSDERPRPSHSPIPRISTEIDGDFRKSSLASVVKDPVPGEVVEVMAVVKSVRVLSSEPCTIKHHGGEICSHQWVWGVCTACKHLFSSCDLTKLHHRDHLLNHPLLPCSHCQQQGSEGESNTEPLTVRPFIRVNLALMDPETDQELICTLMGDNAKQFLGTRCSFSWLVEEESEARYSVAGYSGTSKSPTRVSGTGDSRTDEAQTGESGTGDSDGGESQSSATKERLTSLLSSSSPRRFALKTPRRGKTPGVCNTSMVWA